jgi:ABC-type branched-subunit amino acid transport system substrate-binding protein
MLSVGLLPGTAAGVGNRAGAGVTKNEIKIGLHMPMTGAAPIASQSASQGSDVYWKWLRQRGVKIHGRYVRSIIKNDNYNPSQAVAVCKEMVEDNKVFLLAGIMQPSGADQIQGCARYAASVGVPYVSLGSTETGLDLPRYFAMSKTWRRQARMLADHLVSDMGARREKNGMLRHDTPSNKPVHDTFRSVMKKKDATLDYDRAVSRNSGNAEAQTVVAEMEAAGIDNVFVLTSPVWFLQVLQAARSQGYRPTWVGIDGMPLAGDTLATVGCRNGNLGRSQFLSPLPAFANRDSFDSSHDRAMNRVYNERGDSITWLGWAGSKAIRKLLERAGRDLTRSRFTSKVERTKNVRTHILPRFGFRPGDHFGGSGTHLLSVDCRKERWVTVRRFVGNF